MVLSLTRRGVVAALDDAEPLSCDAIYAQHFRGIWRTLRRLGVSDAQLDDAAQDVFVVVHRKLHAFDGRSLRGWLFAIAVREEPAAQGAAVEDRKSTRLNSSH